MLRSFSEWLSTSENSMYTVQMIRHIHERSLGVLYHLMGFLGLPNVSRSAHEDPQG
jgi:hypothetical protein